MTERKTVQCDLCHKVLSSGTFRGLTGCIRRHRDKYHPKVKGTMHYTPVRGSNQHVLKGLASRD